MGTLGKRIAVSGVVGQRVVDLANNQVLGYELLVRFVDHLPETVFSDLHNLQRVHRADRLAFKKCCEVAGAHSYAGCLFGFNLTATAVRSLAYGNIFDLMGIPRQYGLVPEQMVIEVTEQLPISDSELAQGVLALREAGYHVCMDDVGKGYADAHRVHVAQPEFVKLERAVWANDGPICSQLLDAARAVGAKVVAEGVETQEDLQLVRGLQIPFGQGYLFGRPQPLEQCVPIDMREGRTIGLGIASVPIVLENGDSLVHAALEVASGAVVAVGADGRLAWANTRAVGSPELARRQWVGRPAAELAAQHFGPVKATGLGRGSLETPQLSLHSLPDGRMLRRQSLPVYADGSASPIGYVARYVDATLEFQHQEMYMLLSGLMLRFGSLSAQPEQMTPAKILRVPLEMGLVSHMHLSASDGRVLATVGKPEAKGEPFSFSVAPNGEIVHGLRAHKLGADVWRRLERPLAVQLGLALAAGRALSIAAEASRRERQTGLLMERPFLERLAWAKSRFKRHGVPFTVALLQPTNLAAINQDCGHSVGTQALQSMSSVLSRLAPEMTIGRCNGHFMWIGDQSKEEAAMLLETARLELAGKLSEGHKGLLLEFELAAWPHERDRVDGWLGRPCPHM